MPRYIDADALKSRLEGCPSDFYDYDELIPLIDEQPTISPDEVRGVGRWIKRLKKRENLPNDSDWLYSCSECGHGDVHNENACVPFCWHCGAKMEVSEDA